MKMYDEKQENDMNKINAHIELDVEGVSSQQPANQTSMPLIAGILLILTGVISICWWIYFNSIIDIIFTEEMMTAAQLQEMPPGITIDQIKQMLATCGIIFCGLSIFPILGGILAIKKKLWGIALTGGILGLFTFGFLVISPVLSLIAIILIYISRKEFK